jgi:hypothetical protein
MPALVNRCARTLNRQFDCRDVQFLRLYLQYCLLSTTGASPSSMRAAALRSRRRVYLGAGDCPPLAAPGRAPPHAGEQLFLTLLFMLKTPILSAMVTSRIAACIWPFPA